MTRTYVNQFSFSKETLFQQKHYASHKGDEKQVIWSYIGPQSFQILDL